MNSLKNDTRPIGIFDSGLGGLTVARAVARAFPDEAICYLGDTARVPYGTKSAETVSLYAREDMAFLLEHEAKILIAACNTVSAAALPHLRDQYNVPVMGVVEQGAEAVLEALKGKDAPRIGVIGTETTINSGAYREAIGKRAPAAGVAQKACPLFVPLIEEGWIDHDVTRTVIREYLEPMRRDGIDALILGCTHYPLIREAFCDFFGPEVRIVDSAEAVVMALCKEFEADRLRPAGGPGAASRYFATDRYHRFRELVEAFMGRPDLDIRLIGSDALTEALERRKQP
ncbi:MAG: glutamate racemase [Candidatus Sumerlaeota bacterium]